MFNDVILSVAKRLFIERTCASSHYQTRDDVLKDKEQVESLADTCITLAQLFYDRVEATLPPLKPFELLSDIEDEHDK